MTKGLPHSLCQTTSSSLTTFVWFPNTNSAVCKGLLLIQMSNLECITSKQVLFSNQMFSEYNGTAGDLTLW